MKFTGTSGGMRPTMNGLKFLRAAITVPKVFPMTDDSPGAANLKFDGNESFPK